MTKKIGSLIEIHVYEDMTSCTDLSHHVVFGKVNTDDKDLHFQKRVLCKQNDHYSYWYGSEFQKVHSL